MIASPSSRSNRSRRSACAASSACGSAGASATSIASTSPVLVVSVNDDRLPAPTLLQVVVADAFVLDPLLEEHDPLDERLGPRRAPGHVDVDRDDLVDALGDGVGVPVGTAAVRTRAHRDHVLGIGHLLVETLDRG